MLSGCLLGDICLRNLSPLRSWHKAPWRQKTEASAGAPGAVAMDQHHPFTNGLFGCRYFFDDIAIWSAVSTWAKLLEVRRMSSTHLGESWASGRFQCVILKQIEMFLSVTFRSIWGHCWILAKPEKIFSTPRGGGLSVSNAQPAKGHWEVFGFGR